MKGLIYIEGLTEKHDHFVAERFADEFRYTLVERLALVKLCDDNSADVQIRVQTGFDNLCLNSTMF